MGGRTLGVRKDTREGGREGEGIINVREGVGARKDTCEGGREGEGRRAGEGRREGEEGYT